MFFDYFYSILTAPGVMVHELAHAFFCVISGVRIRRISLFRFDRVAGYVLHDEPKGFFSSFLISFGPLIINSYLAMWLFAKIAAPYGWLDLLLLWLGFAVAMHAIPSTGDAQSLLKNANRNILRHPLKILFLSAGPDFICIEFIEAHLF